MKRLAALTALCFLICGPTSWAWADTPTPAPSDENRPILRSGDDLPENSSPAASQPAAVTPPASNGFNTGWVAISLGGVIGLIFLLRNVGTRLMGKVGKFGGAGQVVKVLGRSFLAPRQQILILQVGRRIIVVGESGGQLQALAQITDADEVAALLGELRTQTAPALRGNPFSALFGRAQKSFNEPERAEFAESDLAAPSSANSDLEASSAAVRELSERIRGLREQLRG